MPGDENKNAVGGAADAGSHKDASDNAGGTNETGEGSGKEQGHQNLPEGIKKRLYDLGEKKRTLESQLQEAQKKIAELSATKSDGDDFTDSGRTSNADVDNIANSKNIGNIINTIVNKKIEEISNNQHLSELENESKKWLISQNDVAAADAYSEVADIMTSEYYVKLKSVDPRIAYEKAVGEWRASHGVGGKTEKKGGLPSRNTIATGDADKLKNELANLDPSAPDYMRKSAMLINKMLEAKTSG